MKAKPKPKPKSADVAAKSAEDEDIDQVLDRKFGPRLWYDVTDPQKVGGPSPPVLHRARREGLIEFIEIGGRVKISRALMKRLATVGLGKVSFFYGKQAKSEV